MLVHLKMDEFSEGKPKRPSTFFRNSWPKFWLNQHKILRKWPPNPPPPWGVSLKIHPFSQIQTPLSRQLKFELLLMILPAIVTEKYCSRIKLNLKKINCCIFCCCWLVDFFYNFQGNKLLGDCLAQTILAANKQHWSTWEQINSIRVWFGVIYSSDLNHGLRTFLYPCDLIYT